MDITIRPAVPQDAALAAELVCLSMGRSSRRLLGLGDPQRAQQGVAGLFRLAHNRFSYTCADLALVDGAPAGLLISFDARRLRRLELHMALDVCRVYGLLGALRLAWGALPFSSAQECVPGEYYVAHLAVLPEFRRQGVASALLRRAEERARAAGLRRCSLIVDLDNQAAQRLYARVGYRVVATLVTPERLARYGTRGYRRMVQELP
ncbi:MAG: GNAT family N-acetyltransferase [Anaerolineaceae bacterium]|nr:GNAT family N-acetyltransferase [Anaerolineaceae bacterium]